MDELRQILASPAESLPLVGRGGRALELDQKMGRAFELVAGGAVNLAPGRDNRKIPKVERIRLLKGYVTTVVFAALAAADGCPGPGCADLRVVIEFQMGPNVASRIVEHALITIFADASVFDVGAGWKNKIRIRERPDLDHCMFLEKYSAYVANKNHACEAYYQHISVVFAHPTLEELGIAKKLKKDFADSVMQVLGYLRYGDHSTPEKHY
jgi:hypothetical protein